MDQKAMYNIIFLKNRFIFESNNKRLQKIAVQSPETCPFCGVKEALEEIKFFYGFKRNYYVELWVCKNHRKLRGRYPLKIILPGIIIPLSLVILLIFARVIAILVTPFLCCYGCIHLRFFKGYRYFWIEYFEHESVIYVKKNDWCEEFLRLNESISRKFSGDLTAYENMKAKAKKLILVSIIITTITVITIIFSLISKWIPLVAFSFLFLFFYANAITINDFRQHRKAEKLKKKIFFPPH